MYYGLEIVKNFFDKSVCRSAFESAKEVIPEKGEVLGHAKIIIPISEAEYISHVREYHASEFPVERMPIREINNYFDDSFGRPHYCGKTLKPNRRQRKEMFINKNSAFLEFFYNELEAIE